MREAVTSAANTSTCAWLLLSSIHIFKSDTTLRVDVAVVAVVVCKYASGYISRALHIRLQTVAEPPKDQLILCLLQIYISNHATEESQAPIANKTTKEQTRKSVVVNKQELLSSEKRNARSLTCQSKQKVKGNMSLLSSINCSYLTQLL